MHQIVKVQIDRYGENFLLIYLIKYIKLQILIIIWILITITHMGTFVKLVTHSLVNLFNQS